MSFDGIMDPQLELWTNLGSPLLFTGQEAAGGLLNDAQRQRVAAAFREASGTLEGKWAVALGRSAGELSTSLYVYYEPLAYLVIALDPVEKKASVCANVAYWPALERDFLALIKQAETLLREDRVVDALGLCIREGRGWVESLMRLGPP